MKKRRTNRSHWRHAEHSSSQRARLSPEGNDFLAAWWNPANGRNGQFQNEWRLRGGRQTLIPPAPGDWAARMVRRTN
ncbi:MAG: hypothetical protein AAB676_03310 [Verrucomicrobiota bacterium]